MSRHRAAFVCTAVASILATDHVARDGIAQDVPPVDTGERIRLPVTGAEFSVLRDAASGAKSLLASDGQRFDSIEAAVVAGEMSLSPWRRVVAPELWLVAEVPKRAAEIVPVLLVTRSQPLHEVARDIRAHAAEAIEPQLAAYRAILRRIDPLRRSEPGRRLQLGDLIEEEKRLLTPEEAQECVRIREDVKARMHAMRREILAAAAPLADAEMEPILAFVGGIAGARIVRRGRILGSVAMEIPAGWIRDVVAGLPSVALVLSDAPMPALLDHSVPAIGAKTWTDAGYDGGTGVRVAILDTGVDSTHPALAGAVFAEKGFVGTESFGPSLVDDYSGHGTTVAGVVASRDATYRGVAPGAEILNAKMGARGFGEFSGLMQFSAAIEGGDWAADNGADIFNYSFGGYGNSGGNTPVALFGDAASAELAISVSTAAGNYGSTADGLAAPSTGFNSLAVGNLQLYLTGNPGDDEINQTSSVGPCSDGRRKPDIGAPGTGIDSLDHDWEGDAEDFVQISGTSIAAPHVAGALALLADYAASWKPEGMKALLLASTVNGGKTPLAFDNAYGWGALDLARAFASRANVHEGTFTDGGPTEIWFDAPAFTAGARVALCWNREVVWNGAAVPTTYRAIVDLDLEVQDAGGNVLATSATLVDSVERVNLASQQTRARIRVIRKGPFPSGQTSVDFAVATYAGPPPPPDTAPPTGSFRLSGDAEYLMPWEALTADVTADDGDGCGVTGFRARFDGASEWPDWLPTSGAGGVPLTRPSTDGAVVAQGEFEDFAHNVSSVAEDGIYLVESVAPSLGAVRKFAGTLAPGGDVDGMHIGLLAGDVITVKVVVKPDPATSDVRCAIDLFPPDHVRLTTAPGAPGTKKTAIANFAVTQTGDHWFVLRSEGADRLAGAAYTVKVAVRSPRSSRRSTGRAAPSDGVASIAFDMREGATVHGEVRGAAPGEFQLRAPDGSVVTVPTRSVPHHGRSFAAVAGGTGTYALLVPAATDVGYRLAIKPPRVRKVTETGE